jgi:hypothetical protein
MSGQPRGGLLERLVALEAVQSTLASKPCQSTRAPMVEL